MATVRPEGRRPRTRGHRWAIALLPALLLLGLAPGFLAPEVGE